MNAETLPLRTILVLLVVFGLFVTACTGSDNDGDASGNSTPALVATTTVPRTTVEVLRLTFDGESCIYEGPTELTPGPVELTFMSEDPEYPASVSFEKLDDDKTFQDMIDYISPEPSTVYQPAWTHALGTRSRIPSGESRTWERDLESGQYIMVCLRQSAPPRRLRRHVRQTGGDYHSTMCSR